MEASSASYVTYFAEASFAPKSALTITSEMILGGEIGKAKLELMGLMIERMPLTIVGKTVQQPSTTVVRWQEGDCKPPLYFIGGELPEFRLAQLMGSGRAIFGIRLRWPLAWREAATRKDFSALPRIEQMAAFYAEALRTHTHLSPCMLAGYSFEGIIAFETARQFQAMGGKVEMVILLDSRTKYPPPAPHVVAWQQLRKHWGLVLEGQDRSESLLSLAPVSGVHGR